MNAFGKWSIEVNEKLTASAVVFTVGGRTEYLYSMMN